MGRRPDFLILGTQKAATTSLFTWLGAHPDVCLPDAKDIGFFADDRLYLRGLTWYESRFPATVGCCTGEASPRYSHPGRSAIAAPRIRQALGGIPLVAVARDPLERARSHYLHDVRRGRERRSFQAVLDDPDSICVRASCADECLQPYAPDHLAVVEFAALTGPGEAEWVKLLAHLGLEAIPRPGERINDGASAPVYTRPMRFLFEHNLHRAADWLPRPVRRLGKRWLIADRSSIDAYARSATEGRPNAALLARWRADARRLSEEWGVDVAAWPSLAG